MTTSNVPNENNQDSSNTYVWISITVFLALAFCVVIAFCGLGLWIVSRNTTNASEPRVELTVQPEENILQKISTDPQWKLQINDEFKENKNKWDIGPFLSDYVTLDRSIEGGKYVLDFQSEVEWVYWSFPFTDIVKDFVASVEIKHVEGNSGEAFGLILRAGYSDYYLFEINEKGRVSFYIYTDDKYTTLMDRTISTIKIGEANEITAHAEGSHFTFYVNGKQVGEIDDDRLLGGYTGVVASPSGLPESGQNTTQQPYPSKFEVDNFQLWIPVSGNTNLETLIPANGHIVFVSDADGNPEIYSVNTDGTNIERLTNKSADDISPKWSPDGTKIAFVSTRDGNPEIYVMNANGAGVTRITDDPFDDLDPAWSPDGKEIAFSSNQNGNYEIFIHNFENDTNKQMTDNSSEDRRPNWAATGKSILYQSNQYGVVAFYALQIATKESLRVGTRFPPSTNSHPVFSSKAQKILYETGFSKDHIGIMMYDIESNTSIQIVDKNGTNLWPVWSPDDTQVAFTSISNGQADIYIISLDGKSIYRLTNNEAIESELDWTLE